MSTTYSLISSLFPTIAIFVGWEGFTILVELYQCWQHRRILDRYMQECERAANSWRGRGDAIDRSINNLPDAPKTTEDTCKFR